MQNLLKDKELIPEGGITLKKVKKELAEFIDRMKTDKDLQKRLSDAADNYNGNHNNAHETVQQTIIPIAESEGFHFSAEEYLERLTEEIKHKTANKKIDDDELFGVAGGVNDVDLSDSKTDGDILIVDRHTEEHNYYINIYINGGTQ